MVGPQALPYPLFCSWELSGVSVPHLPATASFPSLLKAATKPIGVWGTAVSQSELFLFLSWLSQGLFCEQEAENSTKWTVMLFAGMQEEKFWSRGSWDWVRCKTAKCRLRSWSAEMIQKYEWLIWNSERRLPGRKKNLGVIRVYVISSFLGEGTI